MPVLNMHFFCSLLVDNFERHLIKKSGGGRGIRTPEDLAALTDFKSVGFNHSPIPPQLIIFYNIQ
jgi:hypothetical protein